MFKRDYEFYLQGHHPRLRSLYTRGWTIWKDEYAACTKDACTLEPACIVLVERVVTITTTMIATTT